MGEFPVKRTAEGFTWEIPADPMTIRYSAIVKDGTWTEVGDRTACGYHHGSTHTSLKPPTMRIEDFPKEFDKRLRAMRLALNTLAIADAVNLMMVFYREVLVTGISPPPDDSLKFAWGVRYRGEGDHFEINLSRVATTRRVDAPPIVREFEITYRFTPTTDLQSIPANEIWAYKRVELPVFATLVRDNEAYAVAQRETVLSISGLVLDGSK